MSPGALNTEVHFRQGVFQKFSSISSARTIFSQTTTWNVQKFHFQVAIREKTIFAEELRQTLFPSSLQNQSSIRSDFFFYLPLSFVANILLSFVAYRGTNINPWNKTETTQDEKSIQFQQQGSNKVPVGNVEICKDFVEGQIWKVCLRRSNFEEGLGQSSWILSED